MGLAFQKIRASGKNIYPCIVFKLLTHNIASNKNCLFSQRRRRRRSSGGGVPGPIMRLKIVGPCGHVVALLARILDRFVDGAHVLAEDVAPGGAEVATSAAILEALVFGAHVTLEVGLLGGDKVALSAVELDALVLHLDVGLQVAYQRCLVAALLTLREGKVTSILRHLSLLLAMLRVLNVQLFESTPWVFVKQCCPMH
jgi:hypothetical protein